MNEVLSSGDRSRISALRDSRPSPSPHKSLQHRSTRLPWVAGPTSCSFFSSFTSLLLCRLSTESRREQQRARATILVCLGLLSSSRFLPTLCSSLTFRAHHRLSLSLTRGLLASLLQATPYLERSSVQNGQMALGSAIVGEAGLHIDWCQVTWCLLSDQSRSGLTSVH